MPILQIKRGRILLKTRACSDSNAGMFCILRFNLYFYIPADSFRYVA